MYSDVYSSGQTLGTRILTYREHTAYTDALSAQLIFFEIVTAYSKWNIVSCLILPVFNCEDSPHVPSFCTFILHYILYDIWGVTDSSLQNMLVVVSWNHHLGGSIIAYPTCENSANVTDVSFRFTSFTSGRPISTPTLSRPLFICYYYISCIDSIYMFTN